MRTPSLMVALLVAAALAGCTGGTSNEGQLPTEAPEGPDDPSENRTGTTGPGRSQDRGRNHTYDAYLEVSPDNGTAPLNVTLTFGATWQDNGRRAGQDGNGTGNQTGASGNGTGNDGSHPVNPGHEVDWTLEVRWMSSGPSGNATGNGTSGNATGNQTGNGTSSSTSSSQTTTGSMNGTGNATSSQTNTTTGSGSGSGNGTGNGTGTVVASFNGTSKDLPGNETVVLNETGSYTVTFVVTPQDGSPQMVRDASIAVEAMPPGSPLGNETQVFEGSFTASPGLLCLGSEDFEWILNDTFGGRPAEVSTLNVTLDAGGLNDFEMTLFAPNETEIASGAEEIHVEGPFDNGTYVLRAESCIAADVEYTITAIANYVTPGYVPKATDDEEEEDP